MINSKAGYVCRMTDRTLASRKAATLYAGMITLTSFIESGQMQAVGLFRSIMMSDEARGSGRAPLDTRHQPNDLLTVFGLQHGEECESEVDPERADASQHELGDGVSGPYKI